MVGQGSRQFGVQEGCNAMGHQVQININIGNHIKVVGKIVRPAHVNFSHCHLRYIRITVIVWRHRPVGHSSQRTGRLQQNIRTRRKTKTRIRHGTENHWNLCVYFVR